LDVTVTAHNYIPEEIVIPVTLTNYAHLYVTGETYDDDNTSPSIGNNDGQVDAGETIELTITLTNSGDIAANNVSALFSTSSSYLTITQDLSNYGNIAPSASASSQTAYIFEVDKDTPAGEYVEFALDMQDDNSNVYTDNFYIQVGAPELEMVNNVIDDANANGTIDPGETISLYINLFNSGDAEATGVSATLTSASPYVTNISQDFQDYNNISSQATLSNSQPFIFEVSSSYAGETLDFHLAITNTYGKQWDCDFNLDIPQAVDGSSMDFTSYLTEIDVWWDKADNIRGYNIYRSDTENGVYTKINTFVIEGTSYYKDIGLVEVTNYYYKVSTVSSSGNESSLSGPLQAWTTLSLLSGWPITPKKYGKTFSVTVEDVDNDGDKEIFAGNEKGVLMGWDPNADELFDIDNNPTSISGFYDFNGDEVWSTPAIADINQDGKNEIVVTTRYGGTKPGNLYVFIAEDNDGDSKPDSLWDIQVGSACLFGAVVSDLNSDGYKEVIVHPTDANPNFYVFNHDGSDYSGWPKPVNTNGTGANYSVPAIADLDGDGYKEIVEGFRDGKLYIWKH
ncbi:MAG: hypothetical protein GY808_16645, partial [Gammaproteobacteria bacterium]|nr:hypothetical protein [Gammaproteobacteria bacterium]